MCLEYTGQLLSQFHLATRSIHEIAATSLALAPIHCLSVLCTRPDQSLRLHWLPCGLKVDMTSNAERRCSQAPILRPHSSRAVYA